MSVILIAFLRLIGAVCDCLAKAVNLFPIIRPINGTAMNQIDNFLLHYRFFAHKWDGNESSI